MNFIKKILDNKLDESVHIQFQKFSKGEFRDRALIRVKKQTNGFSISTGPEFANDLVRDVATMLGQGRTRVTGAIISTSDLTGKIQFRDKKQFQGVKRYILDTEMSGQEILNLLDQYPKVFFALSFETLDGTKLKIKPKAPKSGKPGKNSEAGPKADFCNLKTQDKSIASSFIFESPRLDFREAEVRHTFFIDQIIIPDELKAEKNFAIIREKSRRKGRILRQTKLDGQTQKKEIGFEV